MLGSPRNAMNDPNHQGKINPDFPDGSFPLNPLLAEKSAVLIIIFHISLPRDGYKLICLRAIHLIRLCGLEGSYWGVAILHWHQLCPIYNIGLVLSSRCMILNRTGIPIQVSMLSPIWSQIYDMHSTESIQLDILCTSPSAEQWYSILIPGIKSSGGILRTSNSFRIIYHHPLASSR